MQKHAESSCGGFDSGLLLAMSNTTAPAAPSTFKASEVLDLDFIRISDPLSHKWAEWEVMFNSEGRLYAGFLGACPKHPSLFHEEEIVNVEFY